FGYSRIQSLGAQPIIENEPSVAIIIPVRDEEEDLEEALQSVCNLNYNNYRIVVVNDRSTDRTGEILDDFKTHYPGLTVITITTLPEGWLGKNNALYEGYKHTDEEWMLFTDADIKFHPDMLGRVMSYAVNQQLDHLCVLPDVESRSALFNSVLATFTIMLMIHLKPWDARNPKSKAYVGIGAFNMVRRNAYEKSGTHESIKLRSDDDLRLGMQIKRSGFRQDVLTGVGYVQLEWYKNLKQFSNGLLKNAMAPSDYNIAKVIGGIVFMLISVALPMPVMFIFGSTAIRLMAALMLLFHIIYMTAVPPNKWWYALMIPFAGFFIAFSFLRALIKTVKQGGIYWRDSFYSLEMLKNQD
ncbi:MAG TPA: glycosyltransferase family 2 protein, partial [Mucilaginibacter sp.]|nr:glycosyltransferase family 2 protein [Mucilaginibacter sp.]